MTDKTKEEVIPSIGDLLPYTNTHSKICIGKVLSIKEVSSGKKWWNGIDEKTGADVFYPVRTSLYLKAYADQEKRKEAIAFAEWIATQKDEHKIILVDNDWYWASDTDGDQPLTEEQLYTFYFKSITLHT